MTASFLTWFSSEFEKSVWTQGNHFYFHRIYPLVESPQNCHPSSQYNLMMFPGNLYPCWGRRCWHMFHWNEWWGKHSLPILGIYLGVRVKSGFHWNLKSFLHMKWTIPLCCTQCEIPFHYTYCQSGIWNQFSDVIELVKSNLASDMCSYFIHNWFWLDWMGAGISLPHSLSRRGEASVGPSVTTK